MCSSRVTCNKVRRHIPVLLAALIFAGCNNKSPQNPAAEMQNTAMGTSEYYQQQMQQSADDSKVDWQLLAIRALITEGRFPQASAELSALPASLTDQQRQESRLLDAQLKIIQQDPVGAHALLVQISPNALSNAQQVRYYSLVITATHGLEQLRALIAQEPLLPQLADKQKNIDATWQTLLQLPPGQVNSLVINADENTLQGWLDLLALYRADGNNTEKFKADINDWQTRYPANPGARMLPTTFSQQQTTQQPVQAASVDKIALLLPLSGQAQAFASAIQKGFNDAKNGVAIQRTPQPAPDASAPGITSPQPVTEPTPAPQNTAASTAPSTGTVQIYDTSNQSVEQALAKAQQDGATLVVGPLLKSSVEKLANTPASVNILALNTPEVIQNRSNICYFSLSPEDEARDAAHHMWDQGKRAPLLIVPRSTLGDRVSHAFASEWQALGGGTALQQQYGSTGELKQGINSGAGLRLTGTPLNMPAPSQGASATAPAIPAPIQEPASSASGGIDAVYVIASPSEIALIKPMLAMRVSSRSQVQMYASSRSFQSGAGQDFLLEMEGLQFSDIPLLSGSNPTLMQQAARSFNNDYSLVRLYAMGVDAWALASHFNDIRQNAGYQLQGETGGLHANQDCVINRTLKWNQYRQGQIVPAA